MTLSRPEWERLRDVRDRLRDELIAAEEEEEVLALKVAENRRKIIRLRKQARLAERRTETAMDKELEDIESSEAAEEALQALDSGVVAEQRPEFVDILEMPPETWAVIDGLDPFPGPAVPVL